MFCDQLTFVIFTFNEEARIERAVRNFAGCGRVLVVDNHSTDRTRELAEQAGATVLLHKNPGWVEDERTTSVVKAAVATPWIYWAFADEMVDRAAMQAIVQAVESDRWAIVRIARKNYYYGVFCHDAHADALNRVFKKDAIDFTGNAIHHFGRTTVPDSQILALDPSKYFVHHFISNTAKTYLRTMDGYTDVESRGAGPHSALRIVLKIAKVFAGNYLWRGGYKAGLPGLFFTLQFAYYDALLNMKRYEVDRDLSFGTIEDRNNAVRERLLKTFG
jgi:hypothetical protein